MENDRMLRQARDRAYFARREEEERSAASHSEGKAREAHEKMAGLYHDLAQSLGDREQAEPAPTPTPTPTLSPTAAA